MKKKSIKRHLKPYSIFQKRKTTINHAFASALSPNDSYNEETLNAALILLGQDPNDDLKCVYCENKAETWDHLVGLVQNSQLRGYGHQIGNLVPCCKDCNSKKGSKDWQQYLETEIEDKQSRNLVIKRVSAYLKRYAKPVDMEKIKTRMPDEWKKYESLRERILKLMKKADEIADKIRNNGKQEYV